MTYNEVIKQLESIGIEIDYSVIQESDLNAFCNDVNEFENRIRSGQ